MLIEKKYTDGDVVSLKLSSGDELVGKLVEEKDDRYIIKTPLTLIATQQGMGLSQFMFTVNPESEYEFLKANVTIIKKTIDQFAQAYIKQTSGIVQAPAGAEKIITK